MVVREGRGLGTALAVVALLLGPASRVSSSPVTLSFQGDGNGQIGLGRVAACSYGEIPDVILYEEGGGERWLPLRWSWELVSGDLVSLTVETDAAGAPVTSHYEYAPGTLTLRADWQWPGGSAAHGRFVAPIPEFRITVLGEDETHGGDSRPGTEDTLILGPGLMDASLARYLGVRRHTSGGEFLFYLEGPIDGDPTSVVRGGDFNYPVVTVNARRIPEPVAGLLLAAGLGSVFLRRRRTMTKVGPVVTGRTSGMDPGQPR